MSEWSQVPALVEGIKYEPSVLKRELVRRIQEAYAALTADRQVHVPEDTYAMQRRLGTTRDQFTGYMAAFQDAVKLLGQLMEEELVEAVGEQDGIPMQGLTVPDAEGDIQLTLDISKVYSIDLDQILAVIEDQVYDFCEKSGEAENLGLIPGVANQAMNQLLALGKFELQVSKVRAYAATLARAGLDTEASIVTGAISERTPYKGVKFERKDPK